MARRSDSYSALIHAAIQQVQGLVQVRRSLRDRRVVEGAILAIGHDEGRPAGEIVHEGVRVGDDLVPQVSPLLGTRLQRPGLELKPPNFFLEGHSSSAPGSDIDCATKWRPPLVHRLVPLVRWSSHRW
jgi:hypothetical protein